MPIRNPFARRPGPVMVSTTSDDDGIDQSPSSHPGFEKVDTVGSKVSSLSISSSRSRDTGDYKMSVVNDSGVYLPPSPTTEEKGLWPKKYLAAASARNSTDTRNSIGDIEHFSISRESFDSYRRSFDISARSPVMNSDVPTTRQSLDSARFPRLARSAFDRKQVADHPPVEESGFEDVGLHDDANKHTKEPQQRRRGLFARLGDSNNGERQTPSTSAAPAESGLSRFLPGRKRGQSGQGAELGSMERPGTGPQHEGQEMQ